MHEPVWLRIAREEVAVKRFPAGSSNPRIVEYNNQTTLQGYDDKIQWCSSFVNWCLVSAGVVVTRSALARSWEEWGEGLNEPKLGCIVVLHRGDPNDWRGHVGFFLRADEEHVYLLGGNQLDEVREHFYPAASVVAYRWPTVWRAADRNS